MWNPATVLKHETRGKHKWDVKASFGIWGENYHYTSLNFHHTPHTHILIWMSKRFLPR